MRLHDGLALDAAVVDDKLNDLAGDSHSDADSDPPDAARTASERQHRNAIATMSPASKAEAMQHVWADQEAEAKVMPQLVKDQIQEAEAMHHVWADQAAESEVMPHVLYAQAQEAEVMQHVWADQAAESEVLPHLLRAQADEAEVMQHVWAEQAAEASRNRADEAARATLQHPADDTPAYNRNYMVAVDDPARHQAQQRLLKLFQTGDARAPCLDFHGTDVAAGVAALRTGSTLYSDRNRDLLALAFPELNPCVWRLYCMPRAHFDQSHSRVRRATAGAQIRARRLRRQATDEGQLQIMALQPHAQRCSGLCAQPIVRLTRVLHPFPATMNDRTPPSRRSSAAYIESEAEEAEANHDSDTNNTSQAISLLGSDGDSDGDNAIQGGAHGDDDMQRDRDDGNRGEGDRANGRHHLADDAHARDGRPPPVLLGMLKDIAAQAATTANHLQAFVFANVRPQAHRDQLHVLVRSNTELRRRLVDMATVLSTPAAAPDNVRAIEDATTILTSDVMTYGGSARCARACYRSLRACLRATHVYTLPARRAGTSSRDSRS